MMKLCTSLLFFFISLFLTGTAMLAPVNQNQLFVEQVKNLLLARHRVMEDSDRPKLFADFKGLIEGLSEVVDQNGDNDTTSAVQRHSKSKNSKVMDTVMLPESVKVFIEKTITEFGHKELKSFIQSCDKLLTDARKKIEPFIHLYQSKPENFTENAVLFILSSHQDFPELLDHASYMLGYHLVNKNVKIHTYFEAARKLLDTVSQCISENMDSRQIVESSEKYIVSFLALNKELPFTTSIFENYDSYIAKQQEVELEEQRKVKSKEQWR